MKGVLPVLFSTTKRMVVTTSFLLGESYNCLMPRLGAQNNLLKFWSYPRRVVTLFYESAPLGTFIN